MDLKEACHSHGFWGKLKQFRIEKTRKSHWSSFSLVKNSKKSVEWLIWRQIHPLTSDPTWYTPEARSSPTTLSLRTPTDQHHWLGCQETSTSVYSRRRCSTAFRALPTIEEGGIIFFTSKKLEKSARWLIWPQIHPLTSNSIWCQISILNILQKRGAIHLHSVSGHQQINTTGWAAINIGIGLQLQKVLKSFPGLAHHRRRKNTILYCNEIHLVWRINFIWVSAWPFLYRSPYIILPTGHDTRS